MSPIVADILALVEDISSAALVGSGQHTLPLKIATLSTVGNRHFAEVIYKIAISTHTRLASEMWESREKRLPPWWCLVSMGLRQAHL